MARAWLSASFIDQKSGFPAAGSGCGSGSAQAGIVLVTHLLRQGFDFLRQKVMRRRTSLLRTSEIIISLRTGYDRCCSSDHRKPDGCASDQRHVVLFRDVSNRLIQLLIGIFTPIFCPICRMI